MSFTTKQKVITGAVGMAVAVTAGFVGGQRATEKEITKGNVDTTFKGKIAVKYKDSVEWWPEDRKPHKGTPNVLLILLDDVGFSQLGAYGGLIDTPNIDKLADDGLIYNNFHTTALSTPSRASIVTGRNTHSIGFGSHSLTAMGFPGYNSLIPDSAKAYANSMEKQGYISYAIGKWDHTPLSEVIIIRVFSNCPVAFKASIMRPICSSVCSKVPANTSICLA